MSPASAAQRVASTPGGKASGAERLRLSVRDRRFLVMVGLTGRLGRSAFRASGISQGGPWV